MQNPEKFDVAVVGAGIIGLAHAYHFARTGLKVVVIERGQRAQGASVRNFGMVWPIGQPPGEMRETALRSRQVWKEVLEASGIWHRESGSLHLAYHEDELAVLTEFVDQSPQAGYQCEMISPRQVANKTQAVRQENLLGAMWSPDELCVFPRQVVAELPAYLAILGVEFRFGTAAVHIENGQIRAGGETIRADQTVLATGDDLETLFPEHFKTLGITRSKLQMLRMRPRKPDFDLQTHLCAGLTLGHYANFRICEKLPGLLERFHRELPDHEKWGIHLLVSRHEDGCLTVGDSHEYGLDVNPFLSEEIEQLMLTYLDTFLPLEDLEVIERWYGVYAKHPTKPYVYAQPAPGVHAITAFGGAGMTLSFGMAERVVRSILNGSGRP